jgi:hypothetical protein
VGRTQVLAGFHPPSLASEPFTVEELRAREVGSDRRPPEAFDRRPVQGVGAFVVGEQRTCARFDPKPPVRSPGLGPLVESLERRLCTFPIARPRCCLDQFRLREVVTALRVVSIRPLDGGESEVRSTSPVVEKAATYSP